MNEEKFEQVIKTISNKVRKIMENTGAVGNKQCMGVANSELMILQGYLEGVLSYLEFTKEKDVDWKMIGNLSDDERSRVFERSGRNNDKD